MASVPAYPISRSNPTVGKCYGTTEYYSFTAKNPLNESSCKYVSKTKPNYAGKCISVDREEVYDPYGARDRYGTYDTIYTFTFNNNGVVKKFERKHNFDANNSLFFVEMDCEEGATNGGLRKRKTRKTRKNRK